MLAGHGGLGGPDGARKRPGSEEMKRRFETKYGYFTDDGREYVITRPDTPKPWTNVICPNEYGTIITQAGTGYSWMTHATLNRLTRWEQDLVRDEWGKHLYCRDRRTGRFWSLAWQPVRARPTRYECRHGVGYTTITSVSTVIPSVSMIVDILVSRLALYTKLPGGRCLIHVGREGRLTGKASR
jgi:cellobiose phosphorylase